MKTGCFEVHFFLLEPFLVSLFAKGFAIMRLNRLSGSLRETFCDNGPSPFVGIEFNESFELCIFFSGPILLLFLSRNVFKELPVAALKIRKKGRLVFHHLEPLLEQELGVDLQPLCDSFDFVNALHEFTLKKRN